MCRGIYVQNHVWYVFQSHSRVKSEAKYTMSKLNFVDLAGSERLSKTKVWHASTIIIK